MHFQLIIITESINMLTTYVTSGGDIWREALNGTVTFLGSSSFSTLLRIAGTFSVITATISYIKKRSPEVFLKWLVIYFLISICMLVPKSSMQVIDLSNPAAVYEVDNVPSSLAFVSSLSTTVGYSIASDFEEFISTPDSMSYTKTGMAFGAKLVADPANVPSTSYPISGNLATYISKCSVPDILINHKYTVNDILTSQTAESVIFNDPSQIISMPYDNGTQETVITCAEAAKNIQASLNTPAATFATQLTEWKNKIFGSNQTASLGLDNYVEDSSQAFYNAGKSQTDVLKRNIINTAIQNGVPQLQGEARNSAMAEIIATAQTAQKMRMQGDIERNTASTVMPLVHSVFELFLVCLFPLIIAIALVSHEAFGLNIIKIYIGSWFYFQMWPIMFSLVNFFGVNYLKMHLSQMGGGDSILNQLQTSDYYSDISSIMGYLCLSIPVLSYLITKGAGAAASQAIGSFTGAAAMGAGSAASQATDGNWSFNNLSMDNVNSNKWNTNSDHREGMSTTQIGNGALISQTSDGSHIIDSTGAISKLPTNINWSNMSAETLSNAARSADQQASSHLQGYNHSVDSAYSAIQDLTHQTGTGTTSTSGHENSDSQSQSQAASKVTDLAHHYAEKWGVSDAEAFNMLYRDTTGKEMHAGVEGEVHAGGSIPLLGGTSVKASAGGSKNVAESKEHSANQTTSKMDDYSSDISASDRKDFRENLERSRQSRDYDGSNASQTQNDSSSNRLDNSLRTADSQYSQYTSSEAKSRELSQTASLARTDSQQFNANMNQDFVNYERERGVSDEELTNVNSQTPLVQEYMQQRFGLQNDNEYTHDSNDVMSGSGVTKTVPDSNAENSFNSRKAALETQSQSEGIPRAVETGKRVSIDTSGIDEQRKTLDAESDGMKSYGSTKANGFEASRASEYSKVNSDINKSLNAEKYKQSYIEKFNEEHGE